MKKSLKTLAMWLIIGIIFIILISAIMDNKENKMTYSELMVAIQSGTIESIEIEIDKGLLKTEESGKGYVTLKNNNRVQKQVDIPNIQSFMDSINQYLLDGTVELTQRTESIIITILNLLAPIGILIIFFLFLFLFTGNAQGGAGNKTMSFGKSRARMIGTTEKTKITFNDVAGVDEEKEELEEIVEFLKSPKKFTDMGARIPKGVLLVGPPGTGKTLLAKAVAGEANVPFYFISGSDFVELFVGVGASRVRDMFKQAKANAPCLIFIDEIDAVGRQRGTGLGGGHDEREQTLNQLLTEMDGFGANEGIIVIAATNRADVLDPALLRPGRFDRQVTVGLPDVREREDILTVHAKNKILAPSVQLNAIAKRTPGFSGADLENLLNEAALLAVRRNKNSITMAEIDEATDRVIGGPAKTSRKYTPHEKELVAYHEAGHAVLGIKLENADDVQKITIIPRGQAGGYTMMMPKEEHYFATKTELLDQITGLLGGRVSEELRFHESTTGAHNDFERATKIARAMVTEYGMSDLGPIQLEQQEGGVFLGRDYNKTKDFSNEVAHEIDLEMRKIVNSCYERAKQILSENQDMIKLIVDALLERETITKEQIDYLVEHGTMPPEDDEEQVVDNKEEKDVEETESSTEKVEESPKKESKNKKQHNKSKQNKGE